MGNCIQYIIYLNAVIDILACIKKKIIIFRHDNIEQIKTWENLC